MMDMESIKNALAAGKKPEGFTGVDPEANAPKDIEAVKAAVEECNADAKRAAAEGTLFAESGEEVPPDTGNVKVGVVGPVEPDVSDSVEMQKQKLRNDVLSFMGLTYVSLSARRKSIKDNMEMLRSNKQYMENLRQQARNMNGDLSEEIIAMNLGQSHDFYSKYEGLMVEGNTLIKMIDEIIARFPEEKRKSVSFVSNSMVHSCKDQITAMKEKYPNGERAVDIKKLENIAEAYACRQDAGPVMNKLSYGHNVLNHVKRLRDMEPQKLVAELGSFADIFKDDNMATFRKLFTRLRMETMKPEQQEDQHVVELTAVAALFITHWLATSYKQEEENGRSAYFKTFVMNVYDYYSQDMDFDIPGGREVFKLTVQIVFACFETAMALLTERKGFKAMVKEYNQTYVTFGAAYAAQTAQFIGDADSVHEPTKVEDYLTDEVVDEVASSVYDWLTNTNQEDDSNDVGSDPEEGSLPESEEEDGEDSEDQADPAEQGDEASPDPAEVLPEGDDRGSGCDKDSVRDQCPEGPGELVPSEDPVQDSPETAVEAAREEDVQSGARHASETVHEGGSGPRFTSPVSHRDLGERDEGHVPAGGADKGSDEVVPGISDTPASGAEEVIPHRLPISDGPTEDVHEAVHEELAHGDDTPTNNKPHRIN